MLTWQAEQFPPNTCTGRVGVVYPMGCVVYVYKLSSPNLRQRTFDDIQPAVAEAALSSS